MWPVQARRAFRCVTIQSVVPSRCTTVKVVVGDFVEISAVTGEAAVIRWYKNGTPKGPRVSGLSSDSVDWVCSTVSIASSVHSKSYIHLQAFQREPPRFPAAYKASAMATALPTASSMVIPIPRIEHLHHQSLAHTSKCKPPSSKRTSNVSAINWRSESIARSSRLGAWSCANLNSPALSTHKRRRL